MGQVIGTMEQLQEGFHEAYALAIEIGSVEQMIEIVDQVIDRVVEHAYVGKRGLDHHPVNLGLKKLEYIWSLLCLVEHGRLK